MGNRAVITLDQSPTINSLGIYLHWNGGAESVLAFAQAAHDLGALGRLGFDNSYTLARLVQIIGNFFGGTLSVGVDTLGHLDCDNHDNGLFVINQTHDADGNVTLTQYPRGLGTLIEPRIVTREDVSTHSYWNDPETGEKESLLNEVKRRNADPFGEWEENPVRDSAPELLAALQEASDFLDYLDEWNSNDNLVLRRYHDRAEEIAETINAAIAKATTNH